MDETYRFRDRAEAGRLLAAALAHYANRNDVLVLALPRGGVPVGFEVARAIHAPLDIFLVRKLGVPGREELAMGAVASGGTRLLQEDVLQALRVPQAAIEAATSRERAELERRERAYRGTRAVPELREKTVILVDDGLATGASMHAAVAAVKQRQPARIVVAVPVGVTEICADFAQEVDEIVCLLMPRQFYAVGLWYDNFDQVSDDEVRELLRRAEQENACDSPLP